MITLHLPIAPLGCPRPRATIRGRHASVYMDSDYVKWQGRCALAFVQRLVGPIREGKLDWLTAGRISVEAVFPRTATKPRGVDTTTWKAGTRLRFRRYDADNVCKAVLDALQVALKERLALEWDDDCMEIGKVDRWYAAVGEEPHIRVVLEPLEVS
jgi:Holliday junction resolvase RusA-like endonuclease